VEDKPDLKRSTSTLQLITDGAVVLTDFKSVAMAAFSESGSRSGWFLRSLFMSLVTSVLTCLLLLAEQAMSVLMYRNLF
jgi:hypothetical protein